MYAPSPSSLCQQPVPAAMLLLLLLLVLPLSLGAEEQTKVPAMQEEFNVLVYGTLQLGQALRDTYTSNNDKLQRIATRQGKLEKKIERLQAQVSKAGHETGRTGEEVERLQREEQERRSVSHRTAGELRDAQKEYTELQRRLQDMEKRVQAKEQLLPDLKERIKKQNLLLQVITADSARQKKQMAEQRKRLLTILKQTPAIGSS